MTKKAGAAIILSLVCTVSVFADGAGLAKKLGINGGDKASKQWERMFSNPEKLKEIGADKLSSSEQGELKTYLISVAADSDRPSVPGK